MRRPGLLDELGPDGLVAWNDRIAACFGEVAGRLGDSEFVGAAPDDDTLDVTAIDLGAFPARVGRCLTRRQACALLDLGDEARRALQEEYVEWRVVRTNGDGAILRVELTTELGDYWSVFAAHHPERAAATIASFADGEKPDAEHLFGETDPRTATPAELAAGFRDTMLKGRSPYNDGERAITCMVHRSNTLRALVELAVAAGVARRIVDALSGSERCLTADESVALFRDEAYREGSSGTRRCPAAQATR